MLFRMQGIFEPVASYATWKRLGRQVVRGSMAKDVIVPVLVNEPTPEDAPIDEKRERRTSHRLQSGARSLWLIRYHRA